MSNEEGRLMTGIHELDVMTRGFGRGELVMVTGRAHSGKTQIVLNTIVNNPNKRVILFTPDEVSELVLSKLVSIKHGINAEDVERRVKSGDQVTIDLVKRTASHDFRNLIVIDESLTLRQCADALAEAQDYWGDDAEMVAFDYLELLPGDDGSDGVVGKAQAVKRWTKNANVPVMCLHQASRSSGNRGQAAGLNAMRYGGESEAIFVIEAYRKREDESMDDFDRRRHANTLSINLAKNKRPPSKVGMFDVFMDPATGAVRSLQPDDMVVTGVPVTTVEDALKAVRS
jgi:replicative DNA helicase